MLFHPFKLMYFTLVITVFLGAHLVNTMGPYNRQVSNEERAPGCLGNIPGIIQPSYYIGIVIRISLLNNQYNGM